jgi:hypothetical protein
MKQLNCDAAYWHKTEVPTGSEIVRFSGKTGSHQRTSE